MEAWDQEERKLFKSLKAAEDTRSEKDIRIEELGKKTEMNELISKAERAEMHQTIKILTAQLKSSSAMKDTEMKTLEEKIRTLEMTNSTYLKEIDVLRVEKNAMLEEMKFEIQDIEGDLARSKREQDAKETQINTLTVEVSDVRDEISKREEKARAKEAGLRALLRDKEAELTAMLEPLYEVTKLEIDFTVFLVVLILIPNRDAAEGGENTAREVACIE